MTQTKETGPFKGTAAPVKQRYFDPAHHVPFPLDYQLQQLVKKIKGKMASKPKEGDEYQIEELVMIDAIQRLGLEYYFQEDINAALRKWSKVEEGGHNLHDVALRFRLLRQAGYNVQADTFDNFKNEDGKFKQELCKDTKGLLSLFEASELNIPGDEILDEAAYFTWNLLKSSLSNIHENAAVIIKTTLINPHHKSLPRLTAKKELPNFETSLNFLHDCSDTQDWIKEIQDLARTDINKAQITLQSETTQISKWWKELGMAEVLEHARNEPIKWHMWSSVALPSQDMAELRVELTKAISFIYIIDDIFDVYGKLEELILFVEAVNRWEYADMNGLPNYMKICLKALFDTTAEMSKKVYINHGWNAEGYLQNVWSELCNAFLVEARWFANERLPTTDEYLKNGLVSSGVYVVFGTLFSLLGEAKHLWNAHPEIVSVTGTILRLSDDLGSAKDENQDGHDGSFLACYMNEHDGSSDEIARECVVEMISDAWKRLNEQCLSHSPFSSDLKIAFLNLARMIPVMYSYDDNHRLPVLEKHMKSLLYEETNHTLSISNVGEL
ncbi:(3S,6E)-nerolidol synthase 1 [Beta vulgaris subsp. vulgaris]|uniref:(3S,6E)-nerolidol synthase 1 n=1 Tax=Beta vulgaris subsp. vulgaris TaxID=3555 RepID=UPI002037119D|nr:(3S,6E)-nerolidol synthase 1 [Beta vulgaris subsp. vulgaris]